MQPAFKIAEQHGHGLDPLFVGQISDPLVPYVVSGNAVLALLFCLQIQVFQLVIRQRKKIPQFVGQCVSFLWVAAEGRFTRPNRLSAAKQPRQSKCVMESINHSYGTPCSEITVGAPSFAVFAKGGTTGAVRE